MQESQQSEPRTQSRADAALLRTWRSLNSVPKDATEDEIDAWLLEPTEAECPYCHRRFLRRYERLNGRCEACRVKLCAVMEQGERLERRLAATNIAPKYIGMTLATWTGDMGSELGAFLGRPRGQLLVTGPRGMGKTHACTAVLRQLSDDGLKVFWTDAGEAIRRIVAIRDLWYEDRMRDAAVLMLDDFGKAGDGGALERVIRYRDMANRPTLITSNLGRRIGGEHEIEAMNPSLWRRLQHVEF